MGSGGNLEFTHRDAEALGGTELLGVVAKAILRLGNTDGQVTESILTQFSELALRRRREIDAIGMIDRSFMDVVFAKSVRLAPCNAARQNTAPQATSERS